MFHTREQIVESRTGHEVDCGFTNSTRGPERFAGGSLTFGYPASGDRDTAADSFKWLAAAFGVPRVVMMKQVHGAEVALVRSVEELTRRCDALVTDVPGIALCARTADCVPVLLHDAAQGVVGAVHSGRLGLAAGVVPAAIGAMRELGAAEITGVIGPHICGGCYEVPAAMRDEVAAIVPATFACTTRGTPSLDIGAGVRAQLVDNGCPVVDRSACTMHTAGLHSYRRDGDKSGRMAAVVVWHERSRRSERHLLETSETTS
jgi:YfiH family protein